MKTVSILATFVLTALVGCEPSKPPAAPAATPAATPVTSTAPATPVPEAPAAPAAAAAPAAPAPIGPLTASIEAKSGSKATGQVTLTEAKAGVHVRVTVAGIKAGAHGLHFHEVGDCSAADATSAKGHYNPEHHDHGLTTAAVRHLGDLGNIVVALDGKGSLELDLPEASLDPKSPSTLRGKSIILHEKTDDGSQPAGNSGTRIGCAVIP